MSQPGSTTVTKLKAWIKHLRSRHAEQPQELSQTGGLDLSEKDIEKHMTSIKEEQREQKEQQQKRRFLLEKHLEAIQEKRRKKTSYNNLSLLERRIIQALMDWYQKQKTIPDGLLELHFKKKVLIKVNFEKITDEFDSTLKIKKMKGSEKLKEMLLIFKRGKNLLLDFYNRDLRENIFTFMFLNGKIQTYEKSRQIANVINHFKQFVEH